MSANIVIYFRPIILKYAFIKMNFLNAMISFLILNFSVQMPQGNVKKIEILQCCYGYTRKPNDFGCPLGKKQY